jgi:hypothetical protein
MSWKARAKLGRGAPGFLDLHDFREAVARGESPAPEIMQRLADAFGKILAGRSPPEALRLQRRGRKSPTLSELRPRVALAQEVELLRAAGMSKEAAIAKAAGRRAGVNEARAKRWYEDHRGTARVLLKLAEQSRT